jgi:ABC-2 type transport system ATP-binding protein
MRRARRTKRAGALVDVQDASVTMDQAQLLAPVSLTVEPGEVVALRGPNGAGKTTLLRCVTGELSPSGGTVHVRGRVPDGRRSGFRRTVAALTSSVPLARDMTVEEACLFVAVTWTADQDEAQSIADRALAELGIARLGHRFPHELSSGQRQLAELATVLSRPFDGADAIGGDN